MEREDGAGAGAGPRPGSKPKAKAKAKAGIAFSVEPAVPVTPVRPPLAAVPGIARPSATVSIRGEFAGREMVYVSQVLTSLFIYSQEEDDGGDV